MSAPWLAKRLEDRAAVLFGPGPPCGPVSSSPGQHAQEGTGPSHIPSQKRGPKSRRHSSRSQAPNPGPAQDPWSVSSATFLGPDPSLFPLTVSASAGKTSSSLNPPLSWILTLCFSLNNTNHALGLPRCLQDRRKTKQTFWKRNVAQAGAGVPKPWVSQIVWARVGGAFVLPGGVLCACVRVSICGGTWRGGECQVGGLRTIPHPLAS